MRVLESAPERYDFGICLLSLGHIDRIYNRVAELARGPDVLDLGCGTGNLALRLTQLSLRVSGLDASWASTSAASCPRAATRRQAARSKELAQARGGRPAQPA